MRCRPLRFVTPVLLLQPSSFSVALPAERVEKLNHFIGLAHAAHSLCHFCIRSLFRCFDSSYRFSCSLPFFPSSSPVTFMLAHFNRLIPIHILFVAILCMRWTKIFSFASWAFFILSFFLEHNFCCERHIADNKCSTNCRYIALLSLNVNSVGLLIRVSVYLLIQSINLGGYMAACLPVCRLPFKLKEP